MQYLKKIFKFIAIGSLLLLMGIVFLFVYDSVTLYNSPNCDYRILVIEEYRFFAMPGDGGYCSNWAQVLLLNRYGKVLINSKDYDYGSVFICDIDIDWQLEKDYVNYHKLRGFNLKTMELEY